MQQSGATAIVNNDGNVREALPFIDLAQAKGSGTPGDSSRAASLHPEQTPVQIPTFPTQPTEHGDEVRRYLNLNVVPHMMDALKALSKQQPRPQEPIRWLAGFFAERANQLQSDNPT